MKKLAFLIICIFIVGQAQAVSSIRYRPIPSRPPVQYHVHYDHHDQTARNLAIAAVALGVVAIILAVQDDSPNSTGNVGYDNYLAGKEWHEKN